VTLLVHAGIADARMWDGFDVPGARRHELRGFGDSPMPESGEFSHVDDLESALGGDPDALVSASFGAFVCLQLAARQPELVSRLVVLDAPLWDHGWSQEMLSYFEEEDRLLEEGDLGSATELNARFWAPAVAEVLRPMIRRSFELQVASQAEESTPETVDLGAIRAPTLVGVGELDKPDIRAIAERLAAEIPDAELVVIEGAAHLPTLERPAETAGLVRRFLGA
jgi:3-oxoadipate enol-lactonase